MVFHVETFLFEVHSDHIPTHAIATIAVKVSRLRLTLFAAPVFAVLVLIRVEGFSAGVTMSRAYFFLVALTILIYFGWGTIN